MLSPPTKASQSSRAASTVGSGESDVEDFSSRGPNDGRQEGHPISWAGHSHTLVLASELNQNRRERSVWHGVHDRLSRPPGWFLELTFPPINVGFVASTNARKNGQLTLISISIGWDHKSCGTKLPWLRPEGPTGGDRCLKSCKSGLGGPIGAGGRQPVTAGGGGF